MQLAVVADELTAAGWRLAGAKAWIPGTRSAQECLLSAVQSAEMVLITAELAARVPDAQMQDLLFAAHPLILIISDIRRTTPPPDVERDTRRALGVAV